MIGDIEIVWQRPTEHDAYGVLLLCHGCSHSSTDFFPPTESCPKCIGLPIETSIVSSCLKRGWVVVAVSSQDRYHKCWSRKDLPRLSMAINHVRKESGLSQESPLAAIGASSGGRIVSLLRHDTFTGLVGIVVQIMPSGSVAAEQIHPPVRFVHMPRDESRALAIRAQVQKLTRAGVDAEEWAVSPSPLTAAAFGSRGPGGVPAIQEPEVAARLIAALREADLIDEEGLLRADPRRADVGDAWRAVCRTILPVEKGRTDSLVPDESPVSEVLNAAWAFHEFTDAYIQESLDWLSTLTL